MHGVIRFLDHPLLPASAPDDYPKIIKSGVDEEGQHPKSPPITGPSGIATLLYRIGHPQLLQRLLDIEGTKEFDLRVRTGEEWLNDLYAQRKGRDFEIGFVNGDGEYAQPGVRYRIETSPDSRYATGPWIPLSTSELGSHWGGTPKWVREHGAGVAKAIWYDKHFDVPDLQISWKPMSPADKTELAAWLKERKEKLKAKEKEEERAEKRMKKELMGKSGEDDDSDDNDDDNDDNDDEDDYDDDDDDELEFMVEERLMMRAYYKTRMACRADCGEANPKFRCPKCEVARYCSLDCQKEDWKYHKTYCGTEKPIPAEFAELLKQI